MADDTLTQKIEIEDNASAAYEKIAQAADDAARAEKERQDLAAAEEQKKIIEQLDPKLVQLTQSYKAQTEELARNAKALGVTVGEFVRLKGSIEAAAAAEQKAADAIAASEQKAAEARQLAAKEAEELAEKERLVAEAAKAEADALNALDPQLRDLAATQKAEQAILEKEAKLLGVSVNEYKRLKEAVAKTGENVNQSSGFMFTEANALSDLASKAYDTAKAIAEMAQAVADLRNDLADASTRTGIATDTLAGLRLAAEGSGLSFNDFNESLNQLPKRISDTARGTGEAIHAFKALGVEVKNTDGSLRSADEVFKDALLSLSQVEDPTLRAAAATSLFGESGGKLLQALGDPSKLQDFVHVAREFGVDVGPTAAKSAGDWQRSSALLSTQIDGLKAALIDLFNPGEELRQLNIGLAAVTATLGEQFKAVTTVIDGFVDAASQFIKLDFDGAVNRVAYSLETFADNFLNAGQAGLKAAKSIVEYNQGVAQTGDETNDAGIPVKKFTHDLGKLTTNAQDAAKAQEELAKKTQELATFLDKTTQILVSGLSEEDQAIAAAAKELADFRSEQNRLKVSNDQVNDALVQLQKNLASATQASVFAKNIAEVTDEFENLFAVTKPVQSVAEQIRESFADLVPDSTITDLERLQLALLKLNTEFAEGKVSPEEYSRVLAQLQKAQGAAQTAASDAAMTKANEDAAGGLQAVSGVLEGSLSAALQPVLSALGPQGAIAGMIIGLLEQGPEAIETIISAIPGIVTGLISTIQTLMDDLPTIITELVTGLVAAIPDLLLTVFELMYGPMAFNIITELINALPVIIPALTVGLVKMLAQLPEILFSTGEAFVGLAKSLSNLLPMLWEEFLMIIPTVLKQLRLLLVQLRDEVFDLLPNMLDKVLTQWINKVLEKILRSERRGRERNREIRAGRNNDERAWVRMFNRAQNKNRGGV